MEAVVGNPKISPRNFYASVEKVLKRAFSNKLDFVFHLATHLANQNSVEHPKLRLWSYILANIANEITGNHRGVGFLPRKDWDRIIQRRASIEKARKVLGYEPRMKMKEGIKRIYEWILENCDRIEGGAHF